MASLGRLIGVLGHRAGADVSSTTDMERYAKMTKAA
jgi:hypothetical protein